MPGAQSAVRKRAGTVLGAGAPDAAVRTAVPAALLLIMVVIAYLPALRAGFIWDDDDYVTANQTLRSLDGLRRIWVQPGAVPQYYPLTFTSLWVNYQIQGVEPLGYHLVNVLLHACNALLLWRVLLRLRVPGAWLAAAIFALHPMMVESVAWVTERKNVLSGACALAALLLWLRTRRRGDWRADGAVLLLFVAALLSKSVTCTLPAVMLLIAWWERGFVDRRTLLRLLPLFVVGLGMALVTVWLERHHVGAEGDEWSLSFLERLLIAGRIAWFYPRTLLWPDALTFIYPRWVADPRLWWQYVPAAAAGAVMGALYAARRRLGRGPLVAVLCYAAMLAPALGFFNVYPMRYSFVADHFAYLPSTALIALAAAAGAICLRRVDRRVTWALSAAVLLTLAGITARQCGIYRDVRSLWTDTLAKNPDCWLAHNNLGVMLLQDGEVDAAALHFARALQAKPEYREALINSANTFRARGQRDDALRLYAEAVRRYPGSTSAQTALAIALIEGGRAGEARAHLDVALQLDAANADAYVILGKLLQDDGKTASAVGAYTEALRLRPDSATAHYNLAGVLAGQGRTADALDHYAAVVRLRPGWAEARYNLATLLLGQGRLEAAKGHLTAALEVRPDYAEAHGNLGYLLFAQGLRSAAIAEYQQALRLKPDYPEAHTNLGVALLADGKTAEAITHCEAALRLKPEHAAAHRALGIALARQGDAARARAELETALRLSPDDDEARHALEQLRSR
jgi:protein O-mannosyl-transferase